MFHESFCALLRILIQKTSKYEFLYFVHCYIVGISAFQKHILDLDYKDVWTTLRKNFFAQSEFYDDDVNFWICKNTNLDNFLNFDEMFYWLQLDFDYS